MSLASLSIKCRLVLVEFCYITTTLFLPIISLLPVSVLSCLFQNPTVLLSCHSASEQDRPSSPVPSLPLLPPFRETALWPPPRLCLLHHHFWPSSSPAKTNLRSKLCSQAASSALPRGPIGHLLCHSFRQAVLPCHQPLLHHCLSFSAGFVLTFPRSRDSSSSARGRGKCGGCRR